jgi:hypothetical protein
MSMTRRITECDLNKLRSEHDAYEALARQCAKARVPSHLRLAELPGCRGDSCRQGRVACRENCNPPEMACTAGEEPDLPGPSTWKRVVLSWIRLCASFRLN